MTAFRRSPAFLFYVDAWRGSLTVQSMTYAERGMYFELLCEQWKEGSAPATPDECAARFGGGTLAQWKHAWKLITKKFVARKRDGRLVNLKLKQIRQAREATLKVYRERGLKAAKGRWHSDASSMPEASSKNASSIIDDAYETKRNKEKRSETKRSEVPPKPPFRGAATRGTSDDLRADFDRFWSCYPRKANQKTAWTIWQKLKPDAALVARMVAAIDAQKKTDDWIRDRGKYIPYPANWLNGERWLDEPVEIATVSPRTLALARASQEFLKS